LSRGPRLVPDCDIERPTVEDRTNCAGMSNLRVPAEPASGGGYPQVTEPPADALC
jgi:hypothetical protein